MPDDDQSVAPKERVNLKYKSSVGGVQKERELPLKILAVGDYTGKADDRRLSERKPINVNKTNFNEVMAAQDLSVEVSVPDRLSGEQDAEIGATLKIEGLKDLTPEGIANQVPELQKLLALREALKSVRASVSNPSTFLKKLRAVVKDDAERERLIAQLTASPAAAEPAPAPEPPPQSGGEPGGDEPQGEEEPS